MGATEFEFEAFHSGTEVRLAERLGALPDATGTRFAVWAPEAERVWAIGDFNAWTGEGAELTQVSGLGVWVGHVRGAKAGHRYKFRIRSRHRGELLERADPMALCTEIPPATASVIWDRAQEPPATREQAWQAYRARAHALAEPMSIYEVHLGSWRRWVDDGYRSFSYAELVQPLVDHVRALGFTHVEFLPVMEHPFFGSWGYQITSYFAPSARYGSPAEFRALIEALHRAGIGVILDWVPSHFPTDLHGLGKFDGSHLYEHADRREGWQPDWNSLIFNVSRHEVKSFLISSALYWLEHFGADGLRVDGVASMLYRDYSRQPGEWIPNIHGGRENLEAVAFLRDLNRELYLAQPYSQIIAEESTAWPSVSRPVEGGGLGFGLKWDMGWMHDTLDYLARDPIHRRFHQDEITFRQLYAFTENFVLPLSHDEVVHGKGSLWQRMPGDDWQKRANLRLLYAYQWSQPGKKLLFMGGELGQKWEWNHDGELDWGLLQDAGHAGIVRCLAALNGLYREWPALHYGDCDPIGFEWIDGSNDRDSVLCYLRKGPGARDRVVVALNFTPVPRVDYLVGVPFGGIWKEIFNGDAEEFGGSGIGNLGTVTAETVSAHGRHHSLRLTLPPLAAVFFAPG